MKCRFKGDKGCDSQEIIFRYSKLTNHFRWDKAQFGSWYEVHCQIKLIPCLSRAQGHWVWMLSDFEEILFKYSVNIKMIHYIFTNVFFSCVLLSKVRVKKQSKILNSWCRELIIPKSYAQVINCIKIALSWSKGKQFWRITTQPYMYPIG